MQEQKLERKQAYNKIEFEQRTINQTSNDLKQQEQIKPILSKIQFSIQQLSHINQIQVEYKRFEEVFQLINSSLSTKDLQELCRAIKQYVVFLVKFQKQQIFFQHAVQNKFISKLITFMDYFKYQSELVRTIFSSMELLLKAIKKQDQQVYLMLCVNKQGFVTTKYKFQDDDSAYFVNFMKSLTRKINEDQKYLNIFWNTKQPQFPLLLNILHIMQSSKDQISTTSIKLALIQICSNLNGRRSMIQKFISNFPFIIFYPMYGYQIYDFFVQYINLTFQLNELQEKGHNKRQQMVHNLQQKSQNTLQNLRNTIKFMEDFIQDKDRQVIQMYTNTFFTLLGRYIYKELSELSKKNESKVILILKVLSNILVNDFGVLKIKIGLNQVLSKNMGRNLRKFFKAKTHHIQSNYWFIQQYKNEIIEHCSKIFPFDQFHSDSNIHSRSDLSSKSSPSKKSTSFFGSMMKHSLSSYIPLSKDNWFYHQIRKISDIIGFQIEMNSQIDFSVYKQSSYLQAIQKDMQDLQVKYGHESVQGSNKDKSKIQKNECKNEIFEKIMKYDSEQILFYYLQIMSNLQQASPTIINLSFIKTKEIRQQNQKNKSIASSMQYERQRDLQQQIFYDSIIVDIELLHNLSRVTSLCVLKEFYRYLILVSKEKQKNTPLIDQYKHPEIIDIYSNTLQKLIYFILTEGWTPFLNRIKLIQVGFNEEQQKEHNYKVYDNFNQADKGYNSSKVQQQKYRSEEKHRSECEISYQQSFHPDIFRDQQCQILYFVCLRHVLGTKNIDCDSNIDLQLNGKDIKRTQIKSKCLLLSQIQSKQNQQRQIEQAFSIILDGQYIKLIPQQNQYQRLHESKTDIFPSTILLPINKTHLYTNGYQGNHTIELVQKQNNEMPSQQKYYCIQFLQQPIKDYIVKQIEWRREIILQIQLKLKLMRFGLRNQHKQN